MSEAKQIVTFGEVLWDIFPEGKQLGGAPFNVAAHSRILGASSKIISAVGQDDLGSEIVLSARELGVEVDGIIAEPAYPTGTVKVTTDENGQPAYEIISPVAWDFIRMSDRAVQMVQSSDAFVFGSLACRNQTSRETLLGLVQYASTRVLDINFRQNYYSKGLVNSLLAAANILKLNEDELILLGELYSQETNHLPAWLMDEFGIELLIITLGAEGAYAIKNNETFKASGVPVEVVNTVGSGDAFLAAFLTNYLSEEPIHTCLEIACELGAFIATQPGAIPK